MRIGKIGEHLLNAMSLKNTAKNSAKFLNYKSMEDMPMLVIPELKLIYYYSGNYTLVVRFANKKLMDEIDKLVEFSGLKYIIGGV